VGGVDKQKKQNKLNCFFSVSPITLIAEGAILGLTLSLFFGFGPAFFMLVQTSIHRGFWSAVLLATGIFLNDLFMVLICLMGSVQIITVPSNYFWFGIVSGIVLILFGLVTYSRKVDSQPNNIQIPINVKGPHWFVYVAKGFFSNIANPFVWIFWIGVVVGISARFGGSEHELAYFFGGTLSVVLLSDVSKAYAAFTIKRFITPRFIEVLNKIVGICLIGFGLFLIGKVMAERFL
jgi:threonine/homoserine/homoserine lactone efflux protein